MLKVLIVDDNQFDREGIQDNIDWARFNISKIYTATNGKEGYDQALSLLPDIIILDISMPVMNGLEMVQKLKDVSFSCKYIIMSCHDKFSFAKTAIELSVCRYILKPIQLTELTDCLDQTVKQISDERAHKINMDELKEKLLASIPALQSDLLREMISSGSDLSDIEKRMQYIDMKLEQSLVVAVLRFDNWSTNSLDHPNDNRFLLTYVLKNCLHDTLSGCTVYSSIIDERSICSVVSSNWPSQEICYDALIEKLSEIKDLIFQITHQTITIGLSDMITDILKLPSAYSSALSVVSSAFFLRGNQILLSAEMREQPVHSKITTSEIETDILHLFESTESDLTQKLINKYYGNKGMDEEQIRGITYILIVFLQKYLNDHGTDFTDIFGEKASIWKKLSAFETIFDIKIWMGNIIRICKEYQTVNFSHRRNIIVEAMKEQIDKNFSAITNVSDVAASLYISPGYANNLFKQEYGITMGDYLFSVRMEAAKKLLEDPLCKIYEITEAVGYTSKSYFSAIFRQYTGLTPKDYRERHCQKSN